MIGERRAVRPTHSLRIANHVGLTPRRSPSLHSPVSFTLEPPGGEQVEEYRQEAIERHADEAASSSLSSVERL